MATELYDVLITYDIDSKEKDSGIYGFVKTAMIEKGYSDRFTNASKAGVSTVYYLPNTTLWKSNGDRITAVQDLQQCVSEYNKDKTAEQKHKIERALALEFTDKFDIIGENLKHTIDCKAPYKIHISNKN